MDKISDILESLVKGIVADEEAVELTRTQDEQGVLYTLKVANEDAGKIIGKGGCVANALREILHSLGYKNGERASLKIDLPPAPQHRRY